MIKEVCCSCRVEIEPSEKQYIVFELQHRGDSLQNKNKEFICDHCFKAKITEDELYEKRVQRELFGK
jgi:hypothetical protein